MRKSMTPVDFSVEDSVYKRIKSKLLEEGRCGEFIVIKGETILGTFPDFAQAYAAGCMKFGSASVLVREIGGEDCPRCGSEYENVGHPLKPGVVMMRTCKCTTVAHRTTSFLNDDWEKKAVAILAALGFEPGAALSYDKAVRIVASELQRAFADGLAGAPRAKLVSRATGEGEPHTGSFIGTDGRLHKSGRIE
jgi:hypothetical protein